MKLHLLNKITVRAKKRLGRGIGSGRGKTAGRGTKGQKAREKIAAGFIGGTLPLYKKLPFRRGLGNPRLRPKALPVSLSKLAVFQPHSTVNLQSLLEQKIITQRDVQKSGVKIVDGGRIKTALTVTLPISSAAAAKIEKAGGKVVRG